MNIQLSDHFTYGRLLRFALPTVVMIIFTSIYGVVDGIFVSNFAGKTAFAAINLIMPYLMVFGTLGFMIGRFEKELGKKTSVVATGGIAPKIISHCTHHIVYDEDLLLKGLNIIYKKNKK